MSYHIDATVFDNVAAGLRIRGMGRTEIVQIVPGYLELFGIGHLARRSARKLSGGEEQRASLARAFVTKPEIVFLDKPFSSIDPPTREGLLGDLERILHETHTTAVMATHDQTEALRLADRMAVMNEAKIVQIGPVAEVMNRPADGFVASLWGWRRSCRDGSSGVPTGCSRLLWEAAKYRRLVMPVPGTRSSAVSGRSM